MNQILTVFKTFLVVLSLPGVAYSAQDTTDTSVNDWTGLYAGINAGFAFNRAQLKSQQLGFTNPSGTCNTKSDSSTFFPGLQLGYMHQFLDLVAGVESNIIFNSQQDDKLNCICPQYTAVSDRFLFKRTMQSSIKGRTGLALNWNQRNLLPYLTAGASFINTGLTYKNEGGDYYSNDTSRTGWLIGAGIEWSFSQNWSLRAEYSHTDYGNSINLNIPSVYGLQDPNGNARVSLNTNNISLAINYWIS
ncbi:MAG TPA: outer membrane beta-barrel protein [Legionella sp.]|nr:outer membrane beta-barrel protein [Legionella sp.]